MLHEPFDSTLQPGAMVDMQQVLPNPGLTGIVYPAGAKVTVENSTNASGTGGADVILHSYRTAN